MPDPAERFIEAATSPLADNPELQIAARHELTGIIENAGPGTGDSLDTASARLEQPHSGKWRYILYAITGIVSVVILASLAVSFLKFRDGAKAIGLMGTTSVSGPPNSLEKHLARNLTPEQKLLLLGDTSRRGKAERFKGLWESDPENPAYFADYAAAHLSEHSSLPPDFIETGRKLDPGNAWFPIIAASEAAKQAMDSSKTTTASPGGAKIKSIKDPAKLDEAIALLHEASSLKRFENYQIALLQQRIPLLPKRTDSLDQVIPMMYGATLTAPDMRVRHLADVVAAKASELAKAKNTQGFQQLLADWEAFTDTYIHSGFSNLVDMLVAMVTVHGPSKALSEAAADLGMPEEAARLKARHERFVEWKAMTRANNTANADMALHSSVLAGMSLPVVSKQSSRSPVISPEELKPGRLADHALAGRALSLIGWLLFGLAALGAGLYRLRCSILTRRLSDHFVSLLRPVDWLWIIGVGIVFPMVFYVVISRFTPLGARAWSMKASLFVVPSGQFSSMVYLMIVLPLVMIRRRLALRGGAVGLAGGQQIFAWIAVISGILALPVFGLTFQVSQPKESVMIGAGSLLALLQLYPLVAGVRALFSRQSSLLRRATVARLLLPAYVLGMLAMIAGMIFFHAEEKHWIRQDRLMEMTVESPSMTRFEYDLTQVMKQELIDLVTGTP